MRIAVIFFIAALMLSAQAKECKSTLFSFNIGSNDSQPVRIIDILENMAEECRFSVMFSDAQAANVVLKPLSMTHIKDYSLDDMFNFLLERQNIFYHYDAYKKVLTVSYLQTKSFFIDYINLSEQTTESIKSITVGASSLSNEDNSNGGGNGGSYGSGGSFGVSPQSSGSNSDATRIRSITEFKFWENLEHQINTILARDEDAHEVKNKSLINREAGIITVTGTKRQIERAENYINKISSRLHKQVLLETRIIELRYSDSNNSGMDWSKFDLTFKGDIGYQRSNLDGSAAGGSAYSFGYNFNLDGLMRFLNQYGEVETISQPKILTLNNQPAVINVGEQINYRYASGSVFTTTTGAPSGTNTYEIGSVFIGLTLNIVPEITDDGFVILRINPVVSEMLDGSENLSNSVSSSNSESSTDEQGVRVMPPDTTIKQLSSIVKVKTGNRVLIGGLIANRTFTKNNEVPLLGAIPVVGKLFSYEGAETLKSELIIIITPKIVENNNFPTIEMMENNLASNLQ